MSVPGANSQDASYVSAYHNFGMHNSSYPQFLYGIHPQSAAMYGQLFPQMRPQHFQNQFANNLQSSSAAQNSDSRNISSQHHSISIPTNMYNQVSSSNHSSSSSSSSHSSNSSSSLSSLNPQENSTMLPPYISDEVRAAALASLLNPENSEQVSTPPRSVLPTHVSSLKDDS
jgi:hypothetical protein